MKKLLWFTKEENEKLEAIKKETNNNNSEAVRIGLDLYYEKLFGKDKKDTGGEK